MSRQSDLVTRLAGDEFVLILPETDPASATELLERMEREFLQRSLNFKGENLTAHISFGIASSSEALDAAELLKLADSRLYESKNRKKSK